MACVCAGFNTLPAITCEDCLRLLLSAVATAAAATAIVVVVAEGSSIAVDKCAVDFSNLLNGFCILNDTFVGNFEELFVALESLLAFVVVPLVLSALADALWAVVVAVAVADAAVAADALQIDIAGGGGVGGLPSANSLPTNGRKSTSIFVVVVAAASVAAPKCGAGARGGATAEEERRPGSSM